MDSDFIFRQYINYRKRRMPKKNSVRYYLIESNSLKVFSYYYSVNNNVQITLQSRFHFQMEISFLSLMAITVIRPIKPNVVLQTPHPNARKIPTAQW